MKVQLHGLPSLRKETFMRSAMCVCLLFLAIVISGACMGAPAKKAGSDKSKEPENMAVIFGDASEQYPIVGTGGIKVTGGHHGWFASSGKSSTVWIDGSSVSAQRFLATHENADFT